MLRCQLLKRKKGMYGYKREDCAIRAIKKESYYKLPSYATCIDTSVEGVNVIAGCPVFGYISDA